MLFRAFLNAETSAPAGSLRISIYQNLFDIICRFIDRIHCCNRENRAGGWRLKAYAYKLDDRIRWDGAFRLSKKRTLFFD